MTKVIESYKVDFNSKLETLAKNNEKELAIVKRIVKKIGKKVIKTLVANDGKIWRLAVIRNYTSIAQVEWGKLSEPFEDDYNLAFVHINRYGEAERWAEFDRYGEITIPRPQKFSREIQFVCCIGKVW